MAIFEYRKPKRGPSISKNQILDIGVFVQLALDKSNISQNIHFRVLSERFSEVVGDLLLPHVALVELNKNTLVLKATSSAWKQELFLQKKAIIDKCNSLLGKPIIRNIRFL